MQNNSFFKRSKRHASTRYLGHKLKYFSIFLSVCLSIPVWAAQVTEKPTQIESTIDIAQVKSFVQPTNLVGKARLSYLFWDVYDAQLFAPQQNFSAQGKYALSLRYLMDFSGPDIAERSLDEMRGQGYRDQEQLKRWLVEMLAIFPDVQAGDELLGVRSVTGSSYFFYNGSAIGEVSDPLFADAFFGIWLAPNTSEPKLRKKLLGI